MKNRCAKISLLFVIALVIFSAITFSGFSSAELSKGLTSAEGAVLLEATSGRVMFEQNSHKKLPMASTTKIVTAYAICVSCNLDEIVEIPKSAVGIEGSSIYLRAGEHLTVRELLYGLMLRSGNDAATALAIHASGSVENFAKLMNSLAKSVGAKNSNFTNPHGLHDKNHYTTAYDLGLITCAALQNADFKEIVSTKKINISNEGYDYERVLYNKNKLLFNYDFADGVKTGYTTKAGRCFVGSATKDGMQLVAVVLNCGPMFENSQSMLEFGFSKYTMTNIVPQNKVCGIMFRKKQAYYAICEKSFAFPLKADGSEDSLIEKSVVLPDDINESAYLTVKFDGKEVFKKELEVKQVQKVKS